LTVWAIVANEINCVSGSNWLLAAINGAVLALSVWITIEGLVCLRTAGRPVPASGAGNRAGGPPTRGAV